MPFDAAAVRCTAYEIEKILKMGRIEKIHQPERDEIILSVKNNATTYKLVISANASNPRMYITESIKENPMEPPMFCMLLRKHISSGKIIGVESVGFERIIKITIESKNELGDVVNKFLMCEIMGKNSNIILVNDEGKIIDSIKRVDITTSRMRNVFPGLRYSLPPDNERKNPLELSEEDFFMCLEDGNEGKKIDKCFIEKMTGLSPLLVREAAYRAIGESDVKAGELDIYKKELVAKELYVMIQRIKEYDFEAVLLYKNGDEKPVDFALYPIMQYGDGYSLVKVDSVCELLETFYSKRDMAERMRSRSYALLKNVMGQSERLKKKVCILQNTLKECEGKEKYRIWGDIITANLYRMNTGDKSLTAPNYYDEEARDVTIPLNEALSPSKNAQQYYKKYQKAKVAEVEAGKQIELALNDIEYLESVIHEIENAKKVSELGEIKAELLDNGVIKDTIAKKKQAKKVKMSMPYEYMFDGYTIYAGKNNVQNDYLTLKMGRANDLWLHTKNIPGSHVLVKSQGEDIPKKVIEAACRIAATNAKGKMGSKIEVDYCPVSHVKKPNGAKAGMVIYEIYETAVVNPDEKLTGTWKIEK